MISSKKLTSKAVTSNLTSKTVTSTVKWGQTGSPVGGGGALLMMIGDATTPFDPVLLSMLPFSKFICLVCPICIPVFFLFIYNEPEFLLKENRNSYSSKILIKERLIFPKNKRFHVCRSCNFYCIVLFCFLHTYSEPVSPNDTWGRGF